MSDRKSQSALRYVRNLFSGGVVAGLSDAQLLERFATRRAEKVEATLAAEAAFAALVDRHGPMVWGVCRLILPDIHEAEDAFQATFLILVRKAGSVRVDDSLGRWLHKVARRVALRAKEHAVRRQAKPGKAPEEASCDPAHQVVQDDLRAVLVEELRRLQPKYRAPIELCHLEGLTHDEAALRLGWPVGTVRSRLSGGRERLRMQLVRRGVAPATGALASALAGDAQAALPKTLLWSTVRAATQSAADAAGSFPAPVVALAEETMRAMLMNKITVATAITIFGILGTQASVSSYQDSPTAPAGAAAASAPSSEGSATAGTAATPVGGAPTEGVATASKASQAAAPSAIGTTTTAVQDSPGTGTTAKAGVAGTATTAGTPTVAVAADDSSDPFRIKVERLARMIQELQAQGKTAEAAQVARQLASVAGAWETSILGAGEEGVATTAPASARRTRRAEPARISPRQPLSEATAPRAAANTGSTRLSRPVSDSEERLQRVEAQLEQILKLLKVNPSEATTPSR